MTAIGFLDDETFLGAENAMNLFVARKRSDAPTEEERQRLEARPPPVSLRYPPGIRWLESATSPPRIMKVVGEYHLGEFVNRFRRGSLTMQLSEGGAPPLPTTLYASVTGAVGIIASLPNETFSLLLKARTKCGLV